MPGSLCRFQLSSFGRGTRVPATRFAPCLNAEAGKLRASLQAGSPSPGIRGEGLSLYLLVARTLSKQSLQYTGRPMVGVKGTCAGLPHSAQTTSCSSRGRLVPRTLRLMERQSGHREGSCWNPLAL